MSVGYDNFELFLIDRAAPGRPQSCDDHTQVQKLVVPVIFLGNSTPASTKLPGSLRINLHVVLSGCRVAPLHLTPLFGHLQAPTVAREALALAMALAPALALAQLAADTAIPAAA